jgi:hypothetical protein
MRGDWLRHGGDRVRADDFPAPLDTVPHQQAAALELSWLVTGARAWRRRRAAVVGIVVGVATSWGGAWA